jgi:hypothetical protein
MPAKKKTDNQEVATSARKKPVEEVTPLAENKSEDQEVAMPAKKEPLVDMDKFYPAFFTFLATIITAYFAYARETNQLQAQIRELTDQIAQRDAQIESLTNEINSLKHPLQEILARDGRTQFEWQWAGENWYGRVVMEQQGDRDMITEAHLGLLEKKFSDDTSIAGQVFKLVPNSGNINITDDGVIHLQFSAQKKDRRSGMIRTVVITGDLQQALCYAGTVNNRYADTNEQYPGDMILVNYITQFDDPVENWFFKDQPWFDRYIVDR